MGADVGKRFIYIKTNYFDNDSCQSLQPPLVLPRWGDAGYSELSKTGWCRLLRIAKDRLVQVKDRLVHVTLVDVSNVSFHRDFCAVLGTVLAHLGQAPCPTWASTLPHLGTFAALGHVCCTDVAHLSPIWQTPSGLKQNSACPLVCDEPRVSVPPRMITHPTLPQGKGQVTLQLISANHISPHLASPEGEGQLLLLLIND